MAAARDRISAVVPVYNEAANIGNCLKRLHAALFGTDHEIIVVYDTDQDTSLPAIERMADIPPSLRLVKNTIMPGVAYALKTGIKEARGAVVVTTMADMSDPPELIPDLARKIREGAHVVSASRYMKGGSQSGGPFLKKILSRLAGQSLFLLAGLNTHDPTNNFRAYSADFLKTVEIESTRGFEVGLELTVKAHCNGFVVDEVASAWEDRKAGKSNFKLLQSLPGYLKWYLMALGCRLKNP